MDQGFDSPLSPEQTSELIARAKRGERLAMERLVERVHPKLCKWARGRLPAAARGMLETGDVVQEVVLRAIRRLDTFEDRGPGAFLAFLRTGVLNEIADQRRYYATRPVQTVLPDDMMSEATSPLDRAIGTENLARFDAALTRLKADDQAAIIGRFEWNYSYADLAIVLGKRTAEGARAAVHRAVERLIEQLQPT